MDQNLIINATKFLNFLNKSPTPFHVVNNARKLLLAAGFSELRLKDKWETKPGQKYFVTKNESTLIAFAVGGQYRPGNPFSIVGAHTDSPCLKLKLVSKKTKVGYLQVGVECYGGGIWHTWFDRDLTVAGRVLVNSNGRLHHKLIHINKPLLRIPNLAIHLNRETNEKFSPNKENHLVPILATSVQDQLLAPKLEQKETTNETKTAVDKHHTVLLDLICKELNCSIEDIQDIELSLCDTNQACLGGAYDEFIFGPRLDNQVGAYCSIQGLIESVGDLDNDENVRMAAIYDHEEVGSESATGAASAITEHILRRLADPNSFELAISRSFLISADQAHAIHPNYSEMHEENHRPTINGGVVLKYNSNQRYTTNSVSAAVLKEAAKLAKVTVQGKYLFTISYVIWQYLDISIYY